jgi:hypothetical protein
MGLLTSQKLITLYERFKTIDVTYTKEIIQATGLITQQVFLKCVSDFWPCVIYSSSFVGAKVVSNIKSDLLAKLQQANNMVSLRFSFTSTETGAPLTFFVSAKYTGHVPYGESTDMAVFSLQFTQRPPDDLIEIMGRLLDANINSTKRKDDRIPVSPESMRRLHIGSKDTAVFIQKVPRRCILRDLSFAGAKIIMMGVSKFLVDKDVALRLDFDDPRDVFLIPGKFTQAEDVEGRKELVALAIDFNEKQIPMAYKMRINDYLGQVKVENRGD